MGRTITRNWICHQAVQGGWFSHRLTLFVNFKFIAKQFKMNPQAEDPNLPGHNRTFLDTVEEFRAGNIGKIIPDSDLTRDVERCEERRCRKVFKSRQDQVI